MTFEKVCKQTSLSASLTVGCVWHVQATSSLDAPNCKVSTGFMDDFTNIRHHYVHTKNLIIFLISHHLDYSLSIINSIYTVVCQQ
jgi:hypothetical protein